jgi:hypothetical protein
MPTENTYSPDLERLRKGVEERVYFKYNKDCSVLNTEIWL